MQIEEIKEKLSIHTVLSHYNLKANRNNLLLCPFHNDKTPSLQIYPKTNTYCCFSTNCQAGTGDQIQFIELMEKTGKHQAIIIAHELLGVKLESMNEIFTRLQQNLRRSKRAMEYVASRHLDIDKLEIGYNGGSYAQLKYCIVFALRNEFGDVVNMYGRSIYDNNKKRHFYQKGAIKGLYPHYPKLDAKKVILTEGIIDAASLYQEESIKREYEILAIYGTQGLKEEHIKALKRLKELEEVVLFMDGDMAGSVGIDKCEYLLNQGLNN